MKELTPSNSGGRNPATTVTLMIFAVVVLAAAIAGIWIATEPVQDNQGRVPSEIAGLRLTRTLMGADALADLKQMHGSDFSLTGGYVAYYEKKATVWVGDTGSEQQAQSLIASMTQKIGAGNRVFTNLQRIKLAGLDVLTVDGMGQKHFYYAVGKATIWVAAPVGAEESFMKEALNRIK